MKISEFKGQKSIELLADIATPAIAIMSDETIKNAWAKEQNTAKLASIILKKHSKSIIEILAALNETTVKKYNEKNLMQILNDVIELLNDEELLSFFQSLGMTNSSASFGSVMESTEEA